MLLFTLLVVTVKCASRPRRPCYSCETCRRTSTTAQLRLRTSLSEDLLPFEPRWRSGRDNRYSRRVIFPAYKHLAIRGRRPAELHTPRHRKSGPVAFRKSPAPVQLD